MSKWSHIVPDREDPDWQCPFCLKRSCRHDCAHWRSAEPFEPAGGARPVRINPEGVEWLRRRREDERTRKEETKDRV